MACANVCVKRVAVFLLWGCVPSLSLPLSLPQRFSKKKYVSCISSIIFCPFLLLQYLHHPAALLLSPNTLSLPPFHLAPSFYHLPVTNCRQDGVYVYICVYVHVARTKVSLSHSVCKSTFFFPWLSPVYVIGSGSSMRTLHNMLPSPSSPLDAAAIATKCRPLGSINLWLTRYSL
jgi:hypothetical protein